MIIKATLVDQLMNHYCTHREPPRKNNADSAAPEVSIGLPVPVTPIIGRCVQWSLSQFPIQNGTEHAFVCVNLRFA